jgi:hypothetical protein
MNNFKNNTLTNPFIKAAVIGLYRQGNSWERIHLITNLNIIDIKIMIAKYLDKNVHLI